MLTSPLSPDLPSRQAPGHRTTSCWRSPPGWTPEQVAPLRFGPAVSPHLAASLVNEPIDAVAMVERARATASAGETLIVEGVGGLLVPLTDDFTVRDLAVELALPLLIAASPGLGTINHTLLTIEAARAAGLDVAGSRAHALAERAITDGAVQPRRRLHASDGWRSRRSTRLLAPISPSLARAGNGLPWRDWLTRIEAL